MEDDTFVLPQFHEITSDDSCLENSSNAENAHGTHLAIATESNQTNVTPKQNRGLKRPASVSCSQNLETINEDDFSDLDSENEAAPEIKVRRTRRKFLRVAKEPLDLKCEWRKCDYQSTNQDYFALHVSHHIPHLRLRFNEENLEVYVCDWNGCDYETGDPKEIVRHVNFHSYHTKLKNIGFNLKVREKLPTCQYSSDNANILPDISEQMECLWSGCGRNFTNIQTFHYHITSHIKNLDSLRDSFNCQWFQCTKSFNSRHHLLNHMKKHTHSKVVGCPDCGSVFCSNTKYFDHCLRRISSKSLDYQCSHCSKFYATERILRDHMISHINHCKCPFCDMTCPYEYTLATHIRHKHMSEKPFKCQMCSYSCKTQSDLKKHLNSHETEPFKCVADGCIYECRKSITLQRHYAKVHCDQPFKRYDCHICHKQYNHGETLTRHLIEKHDFHWPPGFSRFRPQTSLSFEVKDLLKPSSAAEAADISIFELMYKKDEDGLYRLQTIRYESIEVTQEMLEAESTAVLVNLNEKSQLKLGEIKQSSDGASIEILSCSNTDALEETDVRSSDALGERLIAIEELDDLGNVVNLSTVFEEMSSVPVEGIKIVAAATRDG